MQRSWDDAFSARRHWHSYRINYCHHLSFCVDLIVPQKTVRDVQRIKPASEKKWKTMYALRCVSGWMALWLFCLFILVLFNVFYCDVWFWCSDSLNLRPFSLTVRDLTVWLTGDLCEMPHQDASCESCRRNNNNPTYHHLSLVDNNLRRATKETQSQCVTFSNDGSPVRKLTTTCVYSTAISVKIIIRTGCVAVMAQPEHGVCHHNAC